jgi:hypothetical protein
MGYLSHLPNNYYLWHHRPFYTLQSVPTSAVQSPKNMITEYTLIKANALQHTGMHYQGFQRIYTDGSKEPTTGKTDAAIYDPSGPHEKGYRCTDTQQR